MPALDKQTLLVIIVFVVPFARPATSAAGNQPEVSRSPIRLQGQLSGDHIQFSRSSYGPKQVGQHLQIDYVVASYKCRGYQGYLRNMFLKITEGSRNLEVRSMRAAAAKRFDTFTWRNVKFMTTAFAKRACRGRTDTVTLESKIELRNTCGRSERHARNGSGRILLQLQCSSASIAPRITPVRWRYECSGANMYIEGTNRTWVERDRADDRSVRCVYRGR
jgi:hypothetical protein